MENWLNDEYAGTYVGCREEFLLSNCSFYPSIIHHFGSFGGKSLLDIGCGEGHFCRLVKSNGASRVLGVDISSVMIAAARREDKANAGCEFVRGNAVDLGKVGEFDFVSANVLLFYSETLQELAAMCRTIFENLKPGGRFVGTVHNFYTDGVWEDTLRKYGVASCNIEPTNPKKITVKFTQGFEATVSWFTEDECERTFRKAGFRSCVFKEPFIGEEYIKTYPPGFWDTYLEKPVLICIIADK